MNNRLLLITLSIFIMSCNNFNRDKKVLVGDIYAVGQINKDTIYNGKINFYDTATGKLVMTAKYKDGLLEGERVNYFSNGTKEKLQYKDDEPNDELIRYDSSRNVIYRQSFYYGLKVGSSIEYQNNHIKAYHFFSLENDQLLFVDYDSIREKKIEQLNDNSFFFWHLNKYSTGETDSLKDELFIYLPNPPKLNFKYSLCILDNGYKIKETVREFTNKKSWGLVNIDFTRLMENESYAIKLQVDNELADNESTRRAVLFKRIKHGS